MKHKIYQRKKRGLKIHRKMFISKETQLRCIKIKERIKTINETTEREKILNRTLPGRIAAKKMGKLGGRPKKLDIKKVELLKKLYNDPNNKVEDICKQLKISKPSFYSYLHGKHKNG